MSVRALCCIWGFLFSQSAYLSLLLPAHRWVLWKSPPDPLLDKIAAVITEDNPVWNGSATELVALLGEDIQPNILTRRLNVKAGDLRNEYSVEYTVKRTRNGSFISLARKTVWRLVTVVTIKMTAGAVSKIPSQSSQPSHYPNPTLVPIGKSADLKMVGWEDSVILSAGGRQLEANTVAESWWPHRLVRMGAHPANRARRYRLPQKPHPPR